MPQHAFACSKSTMETLKKCEIRPKLTKTNRRRGFIGIFNFTPDAFIVDFEQVNDHCDVATNNLSRLQLQLISSFKNLRKALKICSSHKQKILKT